MFSFHFTQFTNSFIKLGSVGLLVSGLKSRHGEGKWYIFSKVKVGDKDYDSDK